MTMNSSKELKERESLADKLLDYLLLILKGNIKQSIYCFVTVDKYLC